MTIKSRTSNIVLILLLFICLMPSFFGYIPAGVGQLTYLASTLGFLFLVSFFKKSDCKIPQNFTVYILPITAFLYVITLNYNLVKTSNLTINDYFDCARPLIYLFFYAAPIMLKFRSDHVGNYISFFQYLVLFVAIIDIVKFNAISAPLIKLYSPFEFGSINYMRISGTFGYCYNYGFILLFAFLLTLFSDNSKQKVVLLLAYTGLIILTGSRSVYIALSFCIFFYLYFFTYNNLKKIIITAVIISVFTLLYSILRDIDDPIIQSTILYGERLVLALMGEGGDGSLAARQSQLSFMLDNFNNSPILGNGPMKGSSNPIEILAGYYISSWGIIGFAMYCFLILNFVLIAHRSFKSSNSTINAFSKANFVWLLCVPLVGMSTPITDQIRVFNIFFLTQGIQWLLYRTTHYRFQQLHPMLLQKRLLK